MTEETKHTPGPWQIGKGKEYREQTIEKGGKIIATVKLNPYLTAEPEVNAQLIAAAPELLEALESLESFCHYVHGSESSSFKGDNREEFENELIPVVRAAIAKARGQ